MTLSSSRRLTRRAIPAAACIALALAATTTAVAAAAGTPQDGSPHLMRLPQGAGSAPLAKAKPLATTDPNTPINISIILRAQHTDQLEKKVSAGWSGPFLSTDQFADTYGQTPQVVKAVVDYLHSYGISTTAYADRLDVSAVGTASQIDAALHVDEQDFQVQQGAATAGGTPTTRVVRGSRTDPTMPSDIGKYVLTVLGLSDYSSLDSQALRALHNPHSKANRPAAGSGIPTGDGLAPQDFVDRYNLSPLEKQGHLGQGRTIGIVSLAGIDPATPLAFWNKVLGLHVPANKLTVVNIDGGAGPVDANAGSSETDLDVEQSGAIAPKAHVRLYLAPNSDPGFADAFFAEASDNIADTTSVSWGESDSIIQALIATAEEPASYAQAFDQAFLEMGAQGQSNFSATGDSGAYEAASDLGTTNPSASNPSDSPYTTATGGTTLPGLQTYGVRDANGTVTGTESVNIPKEIGWGWDYLWPLYKVIGEPDEATAATDGSALGGSNGGYSTLEPRPSYQTKVSSFNDREFLTPQDPQEVAPGLTLPTAWSFNPSPPLDSGSQATGRAIPDLSTNGDPQTGYAVYDPLLFGGDNGDNFAQFGGVSFVAPQLNGANAVIESALGHRTGFWNPTLYSAAYSNHSPLTPINDTTVYRGKTYLYQTDTAGNSKALPGEFTNTNLFYTGRPGTHWNPVTGLGTPDLTGIANALG